MITSDTITENAGREGIVALLKLPGALCIWDFDAGDPLTAKGMYPYRLTEGDGPVSLVQEGILSGHSLSVTEGQYLFIPRAACPALNLYGKEAQVTVLAWVKRHPKKFDQCEAVAGMWNETEKKRQYCLFLNLQIYESAQQVGGHISGVGGPTPGQRWCMDASIGRRELGYNEWHFAAFSYDGSFIRSYYDGEPDLRTDRNPYTYPEGIFNAGASGADFTVAAVHRQGEMGNFFAGRIGGLAIYNRALNDEEIRKIHSLYPLPQPGNKAV